MSQTLHAKSNTPNLDTFSMCEKEEKKLSHGILPLKFDIEFTVHTKGKSCTQAIQLEVLSC